MTLWWLLSIIFLRWLPKTTKMLLIFSMNLWLKLNSTFLFLPLTLIWIVYPKRLTPLGLISQKITSFSLNVWMEKYLSWSPTISHYQWVFFCTGFLSSSNIFSGKTCLYANFVIEDNFETFSNSCILNTLTEVSPSPFRIETIPYFFAKAQPLKGSILMIEGFEDYHYPSL